MANTTESVQVIIPTALRPHCEGKEAIDAPAGPIRDVLGQIAQQYPELGKRMFKGNDELNRFLNVFVNDENIFDLDEMDTTVKPGDEVLLLPAIAGG